MGLKKLPKGGEKFNFVEMKKKKKLFLQCLSMFVGAICHDLDHRGFNNKFMIDIASPLAAIYSTSTMEHHHFNMSVIILQQV